MEIQASQGVEAGVGVMKKALDQQEFAGSLITSTIDRMNSGMQGMTPVINQDYAMQKSVLNAAYADRGIGTKVNTVV